MLKLYKIWILRVKKTCIRVASSPQISLVCWARYSVAILFYYFIQKKYFTTINRNAVWAQQTKLFWGLDATDVIIRINSFIFEQYWNQSFNYSRQAFKLSQVWLFRWKMMFAKSFGHQDREYQSCIGTNLKEKNSINVYTFKRSLKYVL